MAIGMRFVGQAAREVAVAFHTGELDVPVWSPPHSEEEYPMVFRLADGSVVVGLKSEPEPTVVYRCSSQLSAGTLVNIFGHEPTENFEDGCLFERTTPSGCGIIVCNPDGSPLELQRATLETNPKISIQLALAERCVRVALGWNARRPWRISGRFSCKVEWVIPKLESREDFDVVREVTRGIGRYEHRLPYGSLGLEWEDLPIDAVSIDYADALEAARARSTCSVCAQSDEPHPHFYPEGSLAFRPIGF